MNCKPLSLLVLAAAAALIPAVADAEQEVRVFHLRFRAVRDAATLVEPMLTPSGSLLLQPHLGALTVRDEAVVLRRVADVLTAWDVAPPSYRIRVRLLLASTAVPTPGPPSPLVEGLGAEMSKLFRFTSYQEVDTLHVTAADGSMVEAMAGQRYYLRFMIRGLPHDSERIHLSQLELTRRDRTPQGQDRSQVLLRTAVNLRENKETVVGLARSESANQALILVLWAQREGAQ